MNGSHWSDQELVERLYGVGREDAVHLETCGECGHRWQRLLEQREAVRQEGEVPDALLAAQRRTIYQRLDRGWSGAPYRRWAPVLALLLVLIAGAILTQRVQRDAGAKSATLLSQVSTRQPGAVMDAADAQLLSDVYDLEQASEPRAAAPIRGLFERE